MTRTDQNPLLREELNAEPCIGLLELGSVARGIEVADAVLWEAEVQMLFCEPVQPGKFVMLFTGSVEDVRSGLRRGIEQAGGDLIEELLIPQVHSQVEIALRRRGGHVNGNLDAVGVVETTTVASAVLAADRALKTATVDMLELRIANGLGGKSFFTVTGEVSDVRSSVAAGAKQAQDQGKLTRDVVIPRPHPDLTWFL